MLPLLPSIHVTDGGDKSTWEAIGGAIAAIGTIVAAWFGLKKQISADEKANQEQVTRQKEADVKEQELEISEKAKLIDRIMHLEHYLDSKDNDLEQVKERLSKLGEERLRLKGDLSRAVYKCADCVYCSCDCAVCKSCTNKKPTRKQGGKTYE